MQRGSGREAKASAPSAESTPVRVTTAPPLFPTALTAPEHLSDVAPPFAPGSTRVDVEGRLWIRTSVTTGGSPLYHVVDGTGALLTAS